MSLALTSTMSVVLWIVLGIMGYGVAQPFASENAKHRNFILVLICEIIIVEIICTSVLGRVYETSAIMDFIRFIASSVGTMIIISSIHLSLGVKYEKIFFVVCLTDLWRFLCCYVAGSVLWIFTGIYSTINQFYDEAYLNWIRIAVSALLAIASYYPLRKFCKVLAEYKMRWPVIGKVLIIVYFISAVIRNMVPIAVYGIVILPEVTIAIIIMTILCNYTFHFENNRMAAMVEMMAYERNVMADYCDMLDNQISQTKKIRHDMSNNFQVMQTLCEEGNYDELKRYLVEWNGQFSEAKIKKYSDIQIVNASIAQKERLCRELGIRFEVDFIDINRGAVSEFDLTTIIFNLLDNAINGCKAVREEERFISLRCKNMYNQLVIIVNNSCNTDKPYKRVDDVAEHGIGLTIVNNLVKKYDGSINIEDKKNLYRVDINLNVQPKE